MEREKERVRDGVSQTRVRQMDRIIWRKGQVLEVKCHVEANTFSICLGVVPSLESYV